MLIEQDKRFGGEAGDRATSSSCSAKSIAQGKRCILLTVDIQLH